MNEKPEFKHAKVTFFLESLEDAKVNKRKSEETGTLVKDRRVKVRYQFAGDKQFSPVFFAEDESQYRDESGHRLTHAQLHPELYQAFEDGREQVQEGAPIEVVPGLSANQVSVCRAANMYTAEAVAGCDGAALKRLGMEGRKMKTICEEFLKKAANMAGINALERENRELKKRLDALEAGNTKPSKAEPESGPTPFDDWEDDSIRAYLEDNGQTPHPQLGRKKLLAAAVEVAAEAEAANKAA